MAKTLASSWSNNANIVDLTSGRVIQGSATPGAWPARNHLTYSRAGQICGAMAWRVGVVVDNTSRPVKANVVTYDGGGASRMIADPSREHSGARQLRVSAFCRNAQFSIKFQAPGSGTVTTDTSLVEDTGSLRWVHTIVTVPAGAVTMWFEVIRDASTDGIMYQIAWREAPLEAADL